jgi:predicted nucleotidyltransferase
MIIYEEIFKAFKKQKVKYVLVGGIAVNLLGSLRSTADMDILVEMSDDNLIKVITILKKNRYYVKQAVDPIKIANKRIREDWVRNKHMKALNFYKKNELREVDIIIDSPVSFEEAKKGAIQIKSGDIVLPVISIDGLIKMKRKTGRNIDKLDIAELKKIKKLKETR